MTVLPSLAQVATRSAGLAGGASGQAALLDARGLLRRLDHPLAGGLRTAADLARARRAEGPQPALPTALAAFARLLPAGLPRGELTELVGGRSSGRFSLVLALLAAATAQGEAATLVDLGDGLDPQAAAALGVALERLLWLRPRTLAEALAAAEVAVGCGFPLVAVDLGEPPLAGGRGQAFAWLRLARAARAHEGAVLLASPYRVSGPAASTVLRARGGHGEWRGAGATPRLLAGLAARLALDKGAEAWLAPTAPLALAWPGRIEPSAAHAPPDESRAPRTDEEPVSRLRALPLSGRGPSSSPRPWHLRARAALTAAAIAAAAAHAAAPGGRPA